jgi:8-oxo-dGTP pyrophosphatase MutT (NUDIX family)
MQIFLENKMIRFLDGPPKNVSGNERVFEYFSAMQVQQAFNELEKSAIPYNIVFWSQEHFNKLADDFFSLFRYIEAAGGAVMNENDELLVIFRFGKWDLPKGKISKRKTGGASPGEDPAGDSELPADAAIREVIEETGLKQLKIVETLPSTYHIFTRKSTRILKRTYWYRMFANSDQPLIPETEEDISIVRWISRQELPEILENSYPALREIFSSAFPD